MPINASGPISMGGTTPGESIQYELLKSGSEQVSMNDEKFRRLSGQSTGTVDYLSTRGKSLPYLHNIINRDGSVATAVSTSEGKGVAISGDGNTLALGAYNAGSSTDAYGRSIGNVTIYVRSGDTWTQQTIISPTWTGYSIYSNITGEYATYYYGPEIGTALALSSDGNILAIGARKDNSTGTNSPVGRVWIYTRSGSTWSLQTSLVPDDALNSPNFGFSLSMTPDGTTLAIGGPGDYAVNGVVRGATWIYTRSGSTWTKQSKIVGSGYVNGYTGCAMGRDVSLSNDGNTLAFSSYGEYPTAKGAYYVWTRSGSSWSQQQRVTYLSFFAEGNGYYFGNCVSLSADGNTLVTSAPYANSSNGAGALVYTRSGSTWTYRAQLYASGINSSGQGQGISTIITTNPLNSSLYDVIFTTECYTKSQKVMMRYTGSGASWSETERITPIVNPQYNWSTSPFEGKPLAAASTGRTVVAGSQYQGNTSILMK